MGVSVCEYCCSCQNRKDASEIGLNLLNVASSEFVQRSRGFQVNIMKKGVAGRERSDVLYEALDKMLLTLDSFFHSMQRHVMAM